MWSIFALASTLGAAAMPLLHQHLKPDSASMLFWLRVTSFLVMLPIVLSMGAPQNPLFYLGTAAIAIWMSVTDILYFNAIKKHGAGVVARLLPASALFTFFIWFAFDPALLSQYIAAPLHSLMIVGVLCFGIFCAMQLRHDVISRAAVRDIWFVMVGAAIGPIAAKIVLGLAPKDVAPLAFVMFQGLVVACLYLGYQLKTTRVPHTVFFGRYAILCGIVIAAASMVSIGSRAYAFIHVDNPAFVSMILFTAPVIISLVERALGHRDESDRRAGFGLVLAAALIALLQFK